MGRPKGHILALLGLLHLFAPAVVSKDISIEQFGAKAGLDASPEANTAAISTALNRWGRWAILTNAPRRQWPHCRQ